MINFFYGEDTFSLLEAMKGIEVEFVKSEGSDFNLAKFSGSTMTKELFAANASALPFLGGKRLIIIKNLLLENSDNELKKEIVSYLSKVPDQNDVYFIEFGAPDKRSGLFKTLSKLETSRFFQPLVGTKLTGWICQEAKKNGMEMSQATAARLSFSLGSDLWNLQNEIHKLASFAQSEGRLEIAVADFEIIDIPEKDKIFDLTDAISSKNLKKALSVLHSLSLKGEEELAILNLVIFQFRIMLLVSSMAARRISQPSMCKELGVHPFVIQKASGFLHNFTFRKLVRNYLLLQTTDVKIKTGQLEPKLALTLLIEDFCK
ncbi:MAG: DNA polymerase III subunit delta [Patescibacteria group bacterium]